MDDAILHCTRGIGIWDWASNDEGGEPDVVMACGGDVPTLETLAAVSILREQLPDLRDPRRERRRPDEAATRERASARPHATPIRFAVHAHKPVIFAFHGYPWLIHRLTYRRNNHAQPARARLQGRGHHHDALRHDGAERPGSLPSGAGRHRSPAAARAARRTASTGDGRRTVARTRVWSRAREDPEDIRDWTWPG